MQIREVLDVKPAGEIHGIDPDATVAEAVARMVERGIGSLVVLREGILVGFITERDIVRELGRRGAACMAETVDSIMTANIVGCRRDEQANDVLQKMTDGRFRHMPVMEGNQMVGLISIGDVVKARLTELAMEKDALEGMIKGF